MEEGSRRSRRSSRLVMMMLCVMILGGGDAFSNQIPLAPQARNQQSITVSASASPSQDQPKEFFKMNKGLMEFGTVDQVELVMFEQHDTVQSYILESPDRVVLATWDEELVDRRSPNVFTLTTRPMQFVTLNFQPSIDVKVFHNEEHHLIVESMACSMNGIEHILGNAFKESLKVDVRGVLKAVPGGKGRVRLVGEVVFFTSGKLPLLFHFTPKPVLEGAAIAINRRIMSYAKGKFMENLAADFDRWCATQPVAVIQPPPPSAAAATTATSTISSS